MSDQDLSIAEYEARAAATDQLTPSDLPTLILGLVGEVGSLVSAFKKKRRDTDGYFGYHQTVVEELGDVLWYISAVARRSGHVLSHLLDPAPSDAASEPPSFKDLGALSPDDRDLEGVLLHLADQAGRLAKHVRSDVADSRVAVPQEDLAGLVETLRKASGLVDVTLKEAALHNIRKIEDRWPPRRVFPAPMDEGLHVDEQLPRRMRVLVYEREVNGTKYVFQKSNGLLMGARLTDNHHPADDYRFHDVFHLAHAAVLGWSPTTRALLKVKRKTQRAVDENEDGARAILVEEGLTTWIFETAKHHRFFVNTPKLGLDLLKDVKRFVRGYEAEKLPMWLWESAILQGYAVFRELQAARAGVVVTDMGERRIGFEPLTDADRLLCGLG